MVVTLTKVVKKLQNKTFLSSNCKSDAETNLFLQDGHCSMCKRKPMSHPNDYTCSLSPIDFALKKQASRPVTKYQRKKQPAVTARLHNRGLLRATSHEQRYDFLSRGNFLRDTLKMTFLHRPHQERNTNVWLIVRQIWQKISFIRPNKKTILQIHQDFLRQIYQDINFCFIFLLSQVPFNSWLSGTI